MPVKAPFRFARINRWIYEPDWGRLVSHDVPFKDGLSGTATLRITAKTPVVVGGRRRKATKTQEGEVWPFRLPDGRWALPPSTLQGMCRQILEVAAFGRLGAWIEERRFGIRDLSRAVTGKLHYSRRLTSQVGNTYRGQSKAGWLVKFGGKSWIIPCQFSRISFDDTATIKATLLPAGAPAPTHLLPLLQTGNTDARQRCEAYLDGLSGLAALDHRFAIDPEKDHWHNSINANIRESLCRPAVGGGGTPGTLVFTGKVAAPNPMGPRQKKREFVFYNLSRTQAISTLSSPAGVASLPNPARPVDDAIWQAFAGMHFDIDGSAKESPAWAFWKGEYHGGRPVPVFWWEEGGHVATFGMAFAFKAAFPLSTHDLLRHSHPDHLKPIAEVEPDLPHLIFGMAAEGDQGRGLKRRAWFGLGLCADRSLAAQRTSWGVLSSPKPKYLGLYVRQRSAVANRLPQSGNDVRTEPLAAYASAKLGPNDLAADVTPAERTKALDNLSHPELAGMKLWPATTGRNFPRTGEIPLPPPPHVQGAGPLANTVKVRLNVLPAGTVFDIPLTFHNLRPAELGALLWALSYGDPKAFGGQENGPRLRHRLGMGKPFGLGEVEIAIEGLAIDDADTATAGKAPLDFLADFTRLMNDVYPKKGKWEASPQVHALLRAANPTRYVAAEFDYMNVTGPDSYTTNRDEGCFLEPYADDPDAEVEKPRPGTVRPPPASVPVAPTATQANGPEASPDLNARVRIHPKAERRIAGREGTIKRVPPNPSGRFGILVDGENRWRDIARSLFTVIAAAP